MGQRTNDHFSAAGNSSGCYVFPLYFLYRQLDFPFLELFMHSVRKLDHFFAGGE